MSFAACFQAFASFAVALLLLLGCGPNPDAEWAGASDAPRAAPTTAASATPAAARRLPNWQAIAALPQVELTAGPERPLSLGHGGGRLTYTVQAAAELHASYSRPTRDTRFPSGSSLLQRTFDAKSGDAGPLFVMLKGEAEWEYHELDESGFIQPRDEERCRRCHAEARADSVFGAPFER